jgi:hypothetical protein
VKLDEMHSLVKPNNNSEEEISLTKNITITTDKTKTYMDILIYILFK